MRENLKRVTGRCQLQLVCLVAVKGEPILCIYTPDKFSPMPSSRMCFLKFCVLYSYVATSLDLCLSHIDSIDVT